MASVNKVMLIGNLGRDPEVRNREGNGTSICNFPVATTLRYRNSQNEVKEETEWHRVVAFGRLAEVASKFLRKGSQVYVEGRLRTRKYTGKDGIEKSQTEIVTEAMQFLSGRTEKAEARIPADDDIPY